MDNFGQFGNSLPPEQVEALREALSRRQGGGQVGNAATGGNMPQAANPANPMQMPQGMPQGGAQQPLEWGKKCL